MRTSSRGSNLLRGTVLVVVPLLAGLIGAVLVAREPAAYDASAIVALPPLGQQNANAVGQAARNYRSALETDAVKASIQEQTGVDAATLDRDLTATTLGESNLVEVVVLDRDPARGREVVSSAARAAYAYTFTPGRAAAAAQRDSARGRAEAAEASLAAFRAEVPNPQLEDLYRARLNELTSLRIALLQAQATLLSARQIRMLDAAVAERGREIATLEDQLRRYQPLLTGAADARRDADAADRVVSEFDDAARTFASSLGEPTVDEVSSLQTVGRGAGAGFVVALLVLLALFGSLELLRGRPSPATDGVAGRAVEGDDATGPEAAATPSEPGASPETPAQPTDQVRGLRPPTRENRPRSMPQESPS